MKDTQTKTRFDFPFFLTAILLWVIGIFLIFSATHLHESGPLAGLANLQIIWVSIGILIILVVVSVPTVAYFSLSYVFYGIALLMLMYVTAAGVSAKGAESWIAVGGLRIQPSEFAKIGIMLALARYLSTKTLSLDKVSSFIAPGILIFIPFLLVVKQPDMGTAMVICGMTLPMFLWAGLPMLDLFLLISPGLSVALSAIPLILAYNASTQLGIWGAIPWGIFFVIICFLLYLRRPVMFVLVAVVIGNLFVGGVTNVAWNMLKDYQKKRVISFINPAADPLGSGYQVIQSKVAIGSGHIAGKGYLQGTQTRLSFLPEQHTDFIFSVLGEQFGFLGCSFVLGLFIYLILRGYLGTHSIKNRFTNLMIVGSTSIIAFHIIVNTAIAMGMMPVTGIPLPFLSYGGSFTFTLATLVGLILNAHVSRQDF